MTGSVIIRGVTYYFSSLDGTALTVNQYSSTDWRSSSYPSSYPWARVYVSGSVWYYEFMLNFPGTSPGWLWQASSPVSTCPPTGGFAATLQPGGTNSGTITLS